MEMMTASTLLAAGHAQGKPRAKIAASTTIVRRAAMMKLRVASRPHACVNTLSWPQQGCDQPERQEKPFFMDVCMDVCILLTPM
jgi:hypothetical protein